jgi:hypothetical protein
MSGLGRLGWSVVSEHVTPLSTRRKDRIARVLQHTLHKLYRDRDRTREDFTQGAWKGNRPIFLSLPIFPGFSRFQPAQFSYPASIVFGAFSRVSWKFHIFPLIPIILCSCLKLKDQSSHIVYAGRLERQPAHIPLSSYFPGLFTLSASTVFIL